METDLTERERDLADDEYAGQGGAYEVRDGRRVLVERTAEPERLAEIGGPSLRRAMETDLTERERDLADDEYAGCGGAYEVRDGCRVLLERTAEPERLAEIGGPSLAGSTVEVMRAALPVEEHVPPLYVGLQAPALLAPALWPRPARAERADE
jgi:hypothetical protein